jgi:hypothetical protein
MYYNEYEEKLRLDAIEYRRIVGLTGQKKVKLGNQE